VNHLAALGENTVASDTTASAQRGSILDIACTTGWLDPREDTENLSWVRAFYRDLFAETGGVPVPNEAFDGALINHPDTDLADPALNTSGVPLAHAVLRGELPAPAADQGAVGPVERVPPRVVSPGGMRRPSEDVTDGNSQSPAWRSQRPGGHRESGQDERRDQLAHIAAREV
jgi:hypothetical protein